ncbi:MAG TPA: glycosyltransferase, partial [Trueperaceae bacterium]
MKRIAMISEHASPLAALGGADSGGQNVYVAHLAKELARLGYCVDVFTRRDDATLPKVVTWRQGVRVVHVRAGPAEPIPKEELLPHMTEFTDRILAFMGRQAHGYDLAHANFFMSGLVAADLKVLLGLPFVVTFHALGRIRRHFQGAADHFPDVRFAIEERVSFEADRVIAECPQDEDDLVCLYGADRHKIVTIPCGFDPTELWPHDRSEARAELNLPVEEPVVLQLGRMVPRKGVDNVIRGLARLERDHGLKATLLVVGGDSEVPDPTITPEIGRLQQVAAE